MDNAEAVARQTDVDSGSDIKDAEKVLDAQTILDGAYSELVRGGKVEAGIYFSLSFSKGRVKLDTKQNPTLTFFFCEPDTRIKHGVHSLIMQTDWHFACFQSGRQCVPLDPGQPLHIRVAFAAAFLELPLPADSASTGLPRRGRICDGHAQGRSTDNTPAPGWRRDCIGHRRILGQCVYQGSDRTCGQRAWRCYHEHGHFLIRRGCCWTCSSPVAALDQHCKTVLAGPEASYSLQPGCTPYSSWRVCLSFISCLRQPFQG